MIFPRLLRLEHGVAFEDLPPPAVLILMEVPDLLGPDQPDDVRARLFPDPGVDDKLREDWRNLVHPELFALLATAREIVSRDLKGLRPSEEGLPGTYRLDIAGEHVNAWISALNAARLALGTRHGVETEEDLHPEIFLAADEDGDDPGAAEPEAPPPFDERRLGIVKIHVLAELQAMLIFDRCPPPDDEEPAEPQG